MRSRPPLGSRFLFLYMMAYVYVALYVALLSQATRLVTISAVAGQIVPVTVEIMTIISEIAAVMGIFAAIVTQVIEITVPSVASHFVAIKAKIATIVVQFIAIMMDVSPIFITALGLGSNTE